MAKDGNEIGSSGIVADTKDGTFELLGRADEVPELSKVGGEVAAKPVKTILNRLDSAAIRKVCDLKTEDVEIADVVITMGCGDTCPIFPGKQYLDWQLDDPAGLTVEQVRPIRDEIDRRVRDLLATMAV